MTSHIPTLDDLDPKTLEFYTRVLTTFKASGIPFLVGGTYAFERYSGIVRPTKDLDVFVRRDDCDRIFQMFTSKGYQTEMRFPHWLGKIFDQAGEEFVDIIFNAANGIQEVDDLWFDHAVEEEVLGVPVKICAAEEMIRSKAFIVERERCDSADVAHLLHACSEQLDWSGLLKSFGSYWRVLLSHLILFGFIYPAERERIPDWVMQELLNRLQSEMSSPPPTEQLCQGTLLSRKQYLVDVDSWGYQDARLRPRGNMTPEEIALWTAELEDE